MHYRKMHTWVPNSDVYSDDFGQLSCNCKVQNVYVSFLCLHHFCPFLEELQPKYFCKGGSHKGITEPGHEVFVVVLCLFFAVALCRTRNKIHKENIQMITGQFNGCLWLVFVFIVCLSLLPPGSCLQNNSDKTHKESNWNNCSSVGSLVFVFVVCLCL